MLIPGCVLSGLGRPFSYFICSFQIVCQQHPTGGPGNDFITVKADTVIITESTGLFPLIRSAKGFGSILYNNGAILIADSFDFFNLSWRAIKMRYNNCPDLRIKLKSLGKSNRIHIPRIIFRINKNRLSTFVHYRIYSCIEGHIAAKYFLSRFYTCQLDCHMQCSCTGRKCYSIFTANFCAGYTLYFVNILSYRRHPVGLISLGNIFQFFAMHSW